MTPKYKLLLNGNIKEMGTNVTYPPTTSNLFSRLVINELVNAGCASVDNLGNISFTSNEVLLSQETVPVPNLDEVKLSAYAEVDTEAGKARSRYITVAPGQEATYIAKAEQADKYVSGGYNTSTLVNYVWLVSECNALGVATTGAINSTAVKNVVDSILAQRDAWYQKGSSIEEIRRSTKIQIGNESDITNINELVINARLLLEAM